MLARSMSVDNNCYSQAQQPIQEDLQSMFVEEAISIANHVLAYFAVEELVSNFEVHKDLLTTCICPYFGSSIVPSLGYSCLSGTELRYL